MPSATSTEPYLDTNPDAFACDAVPCTDCGRQVWEWFAVTTDEGTFCPECY